MKALRTLLIGCAAALLACSAAAAGEGHGKGRPAGPEGNCSIYGAGFRYVAGTHVCIKIGGWVDTEGRAGGGINWGALKNNPDDRATNSAAAAARGYITTDMRAQTGYGTVRGYLSVGARQQ